MSDFGKYHAKSASRIQLLFEGPEFSVDPVDLVYDQLIASGIARDRVSVSFAGSPEWRIRLETLTP